VTPQATLDAITTSQRAGAAVFEWEICTAEINEALDAASRRRRHAMKRAYVNAMRSSKWLLNKIPTAAMMKTPMSNSAAAATLPTLVEASSG
jgi:hypothetical protein